MPRITNIEQLAATLRNVLVIVERNPPQGELWESIRRDLEEAEAFAAAQRQRDRATSPEGSPWIGLALADGM